MLNNDITPSDLYSHIWHVLEPQIKEVYPDKYKQMYRDFKRAYKQGDAYNLYSSLFDGYTGIRDMNEELINAIR